MSSQPVLLTLYSVIGSDRRDNTAKQNSAIALRHLENAAQGDQATKHTAFEAIHAPVAYIIGQIEAQSIPTIQSISKFTLNYQPARSHSVVNQETGSRSVSYIAERCILYDGPGDEARPVLVRKYIPPDKVVDTVIAEVFCTMVDLKTEYARIITGESIVFLRIDWDEPTVLYRHTATPKTDIDGSLGENINWTAVSQELAYILRVTRTA